MEAEFENDDEQNETDDSRELRTLFANAYFSSKYKLCN